MRMPLYSVLDPPPVGHFIVCLWSPLTSVECTTKCVCVCVCVSVCVCHACVRVCGGGREDVYVRMCGYVVVAACTLSSPLPQIGVE